MFIHCVSFVPIGVVTHLHAELDFYEVISIFHKKQLLITKLMKLMHVCMLYACSQWFSQLLDGLATFSKVNISFVGKLIKINLIKIKVTYILKSTNIIIS